MRPTIAAGLGVTALLAATGCGAPRRDSAVNVPPQEARPEPAAAISSAAPDAPRFRTIRTPIAGPMSPNAMERLYSGQITNLNLAASAPAQPGRPAHPLVLADPGTSGERDWGVPLTRAWNFLVIHHSASETGCAASFHRAHLLRGWDGLGYHFVIGNGTGSGDGEVEVGYRWRQQARGAHAGNIEYNEHGIGICLVGNFDLTQPTPRQMASLRRLVQYLQGRAGIPSSAIIGHDSVPGKDTRCPGKNLDLAAFRASLGGAPPAGGGLAAKPPPHPAPVAASHPVKAAHTTASNGGAFCP